MDSAQVYHNSLHWGLTSHAGGRRKKSKKKKGLQFFSACSGLSLQGTCAKTSKTSAEALAIQLPCTGRTGPSYLWQQSSALMKILGSIKFSNQACQYYTEDLIMSKKSE